MATTKKAAPKRKAPAKNTNTTTTRKPATASRKATPGTRQSNRKAAGTMKRAGSAQGKKKAPARKKAAKPLPPFHINNREWDKFAVMEEICARLSETAYGLAYICRNDDTLPTAKTIFHWMNAEDQAGGDKPLCDMYARAKESQADFMAEQILEIADDGTNDYVIRENKAGEKVEAIDHEHVQRSKLRVDARKWVAAKLKPRKYGDKLELSGDPERPLASMTDDEINTRIELLQKKLENVA